MNHERIAQTQNFLKINYPEISGVLQRKCACGQQKSGGGECAECKNKHDILQRKATSDSQYSEIPPIVNKVLSSPGQPLDTETRAFFEPRFAHDFSRVRVHTDAQAAESAQAVNALAYTVGRNVVLGLGQYAPKTISGQQLLAHELTHVVQQDGVSSRLSANSLTLDQPDSALENEAQIIGAIVGAGGYVASETSSTTRRRGVSEPIISRADPQAVARTLGLGQTVGTGLQFFPTNVTDTRVGPVSVRGGLLDSRASRLNVIIGENLTLRTLARQLLPLWTTATPFTPTGAAAPLPLDIITEEQLAQGLLVYNRFFLRVPRMTIWRAGLRLPLPVEINETTGIATLNPTLIRWMAGSFDPSWTPLLDLRAGATATPPAAMLQADTAAFLAREPTSLARGIHLGARALTNAVAELPFIREIFRQMGVGAFDVALAFMDNLVNQEIALLAAQRDGAAILAEIRTALAAAPAVLTADQQASVTRANQMLARVVGIAAVAPPSATATRAEKTVTIDTVRLAGSTHNPATDVAIANGIYTQCNVRFAHGINATATAAETTTWIGGDTDLRAATTCGSATAEERRLYAGATARFGLTARLRAFYPATFSRVNAHAYAVPRFCATGPARPLRDMAIVQNSADTIDLAHEITHILLNSERHGRIPNLMGPVPGMTLTNRQCNTIYRNA